MSKTKIMKPSRSGISHNMMLLHLRWQQMRSELLQQMATLPDPTESRQRSAPKKAFAVA